VTPDQAKQFIKALGGKPQHDGVWVRSPCPLAPFLHQSGKDTHPSFAVNVQEGQRAFFHCFTCMSGSIEQLLQTLEMYAAKDAPYQTKYDFKTARQIMDDEEVVVMPLPAFSEFGAAADKTFVEWPGGFLENFIEWKYSKECVLYIKYRGIPYEQADAMGLRYDPLRRMLVFPFRTVYGRLAGARGRSCLFNANLKHYDYTWNEVNNSKLVWYNEQALQLMQPVVIVEGQIDALAVQRVYPAVMANLTAKPTYEKMRKLQDAPAVVTMLDNDSTGDAARAKYEEYFIDKGMTYAHIIPPKEYDENGKLVKNDPDKLGVDWIRSQLAQLELV
jgi:5S rRNA maturation endonuclease (ribonuclease M5)